MITTEEIEKIKPLNRKTSGLYFDNNNICDACSSGENKHGLNFQSPNDNIDWEKRKTETCNNC